MGFCVLWRLRNQRNAFFICISTRGLSLLFTVKKVSKYGVVSAPYFPVLGLNTGKYGLEITLYLGPFFAVVVVAQIKFLAHYRYGAVARSISTSY